MFRRPREKEIRLSDGNMCKAGDWVQHIEDAPNQATKVVEVFETGFVLTKWPDRRRWVEKSDFLVLSSRDKRLRKK